MGIIASIKKGFSIASSSLNLVAVLFVFGLVWNLINLAMTARIPADGDPDPATATAMVVAGVVFLLLTIFFQAGSLGYVNDKLKSGAASLKNFGAAGGRFYLPILVVALIVTLIIGVFVLLATVAANALTGSLQPVGVVLAILAAALGVTFVVMLFLAPYIVVCEPSKPFPALRLSMTLVKKNAGVLLGLALLLVLIGFGVGLILGAIFAGLALVIAEPVSQVVFAVLSSIVNAYLGVVVTAAFMTFYLALPKGSVPNNN